MGYLKCAECGYLSHTEECPMCESVCKPTNTDNKQLAEDWLPEDSDAWTGSSEFGEFDEEEEEDDSDSY